MPSCPCFGRRYKAIPGRAVVAGGIGGEEIRGGHGCQQIVCDGEGGLSGLFLGVVKAGDELRHLRVFCQPHIQCGEHGDNAGLLKTSIVSQEQIEEISRSDAGVEAIGVAEATDPSVFDDVQDKGAAAMLTD